MALSVNGGGNGSRRRNRGGASLSEINVTPFVDVVLVLLIIFMLTAHVMDFGIEVEVPQTTTVKDTSKELPVVIIQKDGTTLPQRQALQHSRPRRRGQTQIRQDR